MAKKQLTYAQSSQNFTLRKRGCSYRCIARDVGLHNRTINSAFRHIPATMGSARPGAAYETNVPPSHPSSDRQGVAPSHPPQTGPDIVA